MATPAFELELNASQERELYDVEHKLLFNVGGYASGKTVTGALIFLDRSDWDTSQRGGYFANTETQVLEGLFPVLEPWLEKAGIEYVFGSQPPPRWVRRWDMLGIPFPSRGPRCRSTLIFDTGLHVVFGGLGNRKYKRFKGYEFGWIIVEEITEQASSEALDFLIPRVRCGQWQDDICRRFHRHQVYVHGNAPPPSDPHWIRNYLRTLDEREAERAKQGLAPYFMRIQSSTHENVANIGPEYTDTIRASLDDITAEAMLGGSIQQHRSSRAIRTFTDANVIPIGYDPNRDVYVSLDFNVSPAVASLGQVLRPEEVPELKRFAKFEHFGFFGEFFHVGGMDVEELCLHLIRGDADAVHLGGHWPANFKGLLPHRGRVYMHGDATGGMRRMESPGLKSAWSIVNSVMRENLGKRYEFLAPRANPSVHDSVHCVCGKFRASNGDSTLWIAPRCVEIRNDLDEGAWRDDGIDLDDRDPQRGHLLATVRYLVSKRYPLVTRFRVDRTSAISAIEDDISRHLPPLGRPVL